MSKMIIRTESLVKDYGGGRGVKDLNLEIPENCIFGYIGPNGSGKTTTIKMVCGLIAPTSGRAWVDDLEVLPKNSAKIKRLIGYLPDEFGVYEQMTVWEYLDFFGAAYKIPPKQRKERIEAVLDITEAEHMIDYLVSSLSRGMHQKIGIAKTLLHDPKLLIWSVSWRRGNC
jgi:ABC-2 type transport system ATP-binding protein